MSSIRRVVQAAVQNPRSPVPRVAKLKIVKEREGNLGHRPIEPGLRLPPEAPPEPEWLETFPPIKVGRKPAKPPALPSRPGRPRGDTDPVEHAAYVQAHLAGLLEHFAYHAALRQHEELVQLRAEAVRCRLVARTVWREIVPALDAQGLLARIDGRRLKRCCELEARIDQAERDISRRGLNVEGERGLAKNPSVSALHGFGTAAKELAAEFGLSPLHRDRLNPREGSDDGDGDWD